MQKVLNLRQYQEDCLDKIQKKFASGINRQLISVATGGGKTIIFASLIKRSNVKTLVIAHTDELIQQAYDKIKFVYPDADIGICKAKLNEINHNIIIGSIQSICKDKRLELLKQQDIKLVVVDEAHHSAAKTYKKVLAQLGFLKDIDKSKLLIGFTATPRRGDSVRLDNIYQEITYELNILDMIRANHLSDFKCRRIETNVDISELKLKSSEFQLSELSKLVNVHTRNSLIVNAYKKIVEKKNIKLAIAFCCDIKHAIDLAKEFTDNDIAAGVVHSKLSSAERVDVIEKFKKGELKVLTNCGILTEGFDAPAIDCILMCRPTRSATLFIQMLGRGLRPHPAKIYCYILDFTDNNTKHKAVSINNLFGKDMKDDESLLESENRENSEKCLGDDPDIADKKLRKLVKELDRKRKEIASRENLNLISQIKWLELLDKDGNIHYIANQDKETYIKLKNDGDDLYKFMVITDKKVVQSSDKFETMNIAQYRAEEYFKKNKTPLMDKNAAWRKSNRPMTDKQRTTLIKFKVPEEEYRDLDISQASDLIGKLILEANSRWYK